TSKRRSRSLRTGDDMRAAITQAITRAFAAIQGFGNLPTVLKQASLPTDQFVTDASAVSAPTSRVVTPSQLENYIFGLVSKGLRVEVVWDIDHTLVDNRS